MMNRAVDPGHAERASARRRRGLAAAALAALLSSVVSAQEPEQGSGSRDVERGTPRFVDEIWPIFQAHCHGCHGSFYELGGLSLYSAAGIRRGSENGPVLEPGEPEKSELYRRISLPEEHAERMPQKAKRLGQSEIDTIRAWIAAGAPLGQFVDGDRLDD